MGSFDTPTVNLVEVRTYLGIRNSVWFFNSLRRVCFPLELKICRDCFTFVLNILIAKWRKHFYLCFIDPYLYLFICLSARRSSMFEL